MGWLVMIVVRRCAGHAQIHSGSSIRCTCYAVVAGGAVVRHERARRRIAANAAWFRAYWSACALLLAPCWLRALWRRGTVISLRTRFAGDCRAAWLGPSGDRSPRSPCVGAWPGLGGWIFYNTNVLERIPVPPRMTGNCAADYEKTVSGLRETAAAAHRRRDAGSGLCTRSGLGPTSAAATCWRTAPPRPLSGRACEPGATICEVAESRRCRAPRWRASGKDFNYRIYRFAEPLAPGERATLAFQLLSRAAWLPHRAADTRLVANGTFLDNFEIAPILGPCRGLRTCRIGSERRKYGLAPESRPPRLEDESARAVQRAAPRQRLGDCRHHRLRPIADQIAVAPGYRVSEDGHATDAARCAIAPMRRSRTSSRSSRRAMRWPATAGTNVELAVYHHPTHDTNVQSMLKSMKTSLELFSAGLQSLPVPATAHPRVPGLRELRAVVCQHRAVLRGHRVHPAPQGSRTTSTSPAYVTAHEIGHQWWAHQLIPVRAAGRDAAGRVAWRSTRRCG
jgi:hypothetical protein